jgi:hypothetical protein
MEYPPLKGLSGFLGQGDEVPKEDILERNMSHSSI